jgi:integrase
VALIVKRWALEAGFDSALFAGHSLRSGLATAAAKAGKSERSIMKQTGHRSVTVVVRRYIRDAELFDDNAAGGIAL